MNQLLVPIGEVSLTLAKRHDPDKYYRNRNNLWTYCNFRGVVAAKAKPVKAGTVFKVNIHQISRNATDRQIERALPARHRFDESAVCAVVARMIQKQRQQESDDLETFNSKSNLFYIDACAVPLTWHDYGRIIGQWYVGAWKRDNLGWVAGTRVFSLA